MGITHILNAAHASWECTGDGIDYGPDIQYYGITAEDCPEFNMSVYFRRGAQFIHQALSTPSGKYLKITLTNKKNFGAESTMKIHNKLIMFVRGLRVHTHSCITYVLGKI